jgi:hypothetical protein
MSDDTTPGASLQWWWNHDKLDITVYILYIYYEQMEIRQENQIKILNEMHQQGQTVIKYLYKALWR